MYRYSVKKQEVQTSQILKQKFWKCKIKKEVNLFLKIFISSENIKLTHEDSGLISNIISVI
jgi:hypothetical protein